jgi:lysophospholipase L1-like esterase
VLAVGLFALLAVVAAPRGGVADEVRPVPGPTRSVPDESTIARHFDGSAPVTWVFVGDSITHGSSHTHGRRSFVEHFAERTRTELGRVGDVVINTGISGDRTADVLAGFDARVRRFHPDVVVVLLGTNDSVEGPGGRDGFRARLSRIVSRVRDLGAVPVLQTPPPADPAAARGHDDLGAYVDLVRDVAGSHDVVLVDHYAHWLEAGDGGPPDAWLDDPIHPNGLGHLEMARTIFRRLHVFDPRTPTGGADWWGADRARGTTTGKGPSEHG